MRSLLFVPANSERKIAKALASGADAIILDLEDSVAPADKPEARVIAAATLTGHSVPRQPAIIVRVNALDSGETETDMAAIAGCAPDGIMLPKTAGGEDVNLFVADHGPCPPIIAIATETASAMFGLGTYHAASDHLFGLAWGAEDLSSALGAQSNRDENGNLSEPYRLARTLCLLGARAAGVEPVDTVHVNFRDLAGLESECRAAARDGFTGKMAIHPDQVAVINRAFTPSAEAIAEAEAVIAAFAAAGGAGVVGIDGKMYDIPHLRRAEKLLARARLYSA